MTGPTARPATGVVALVGGGPGDPDLLTRRAARRLAEADVIVYDALVDPGVLTLAPTARRIFVGKRAGRPGMRQESINALLIRLARAGKRVVRLKGGDPFVFGRGGEEALALAFAGVPFEIVPGVSAATAAAALAGIPVTHREIAAAFVVVSGHAEAAYEPILRTLPPNAATVVVMMGLASRARIAALLIERGWQRATPAAILLAAATPSSITHTTSLDQLAASSNSADSRPGTIVIGDVVRLRARLHAVSTRLPGADSPAQHPLTIGRRA